MEASLVPNVSTGVFEDVEAEKVPTEVRPGLPVESAERNTKTSENFLCERPPKFSTHFIPLS